MASRRAWRHTTTSSTARGYGAAWAKLRAMKLRWTPVCEVCHDAPATAVDHITPKAAGGTDAAENLRSICRACHQAKSSAEGAAASRAKVRSPHGTPRTETPADRPQAPQGKPRQAPAQ